MTVLFTLSKPELKKTASGGRAEDQFSFPGCWRESKCGSKTKRGSQRLFPTFPDGFWPSKEVLWKVLGGDGTKRELRRRREKAAPLD